MKETPAKCRRFLVDHVHCTRMDDAGEVEGGAFMTQASGSTPPRQPAVMTPCTGVCTLDHDGYCFGCHRTGAEIAGWLQMNDAQRQYLMDVVLPARERCIK